MHDLMGVTGALIAAGFAVQIETSGTQPVRVDDGTWVTVSPKIAMPGGFAVRQDAMRRADEIKMPVGRPADVERLAALLADHAPLRGAVWLQPLSRSPRATALCVEAATERGWKVSVQVHAYIGVR
jgi:7-carboxy-7-deazaguanine synthase